MKRTIAIAIALALSLSTSFALAGDAAEPTELKTKEPIKQALAAPDGSLLLLEGEITQYARRVAGKDAPKIEKGRILVWDLAKNEEASALTDIPDGATHMAVSGSRLLVACGENGLAVVDLKTKAVKKIATASFKPYQVCTDAAPGKALIFATGSPSGTTHSSINDRMLIEVDLETQKTTLLMDRPFGDYALVAKNMLVVQGEFTSGPCATPRFHSLPECRKPADNKYAGVVGGVQASARTNEGGGRGWHQDWGMWRVVNGGANIVATEDFEQRILCMPSDCNKVVWTVPGDLYSVYPSKPLLLAFKSEGKEKNARADGPRSSPKEQWKLVGLHSANGKQVFSTTITFDFKASLGSRGDQVNFCQTIVSTKDGDKLVFAVRESGSGGGAGGRKGKNAAAASEKVVWLSADLPKVDLSAVPILEGEPAPTVRLTETYTFSPKVTNGDKAKFSLKSGPDGVKVDETTARVTWRPTDKQIGKHDIEVLAKVGADEFTVLSFEVKVTTADEFVAKELDLGELQAGRIIASEDGASLFILEAKVQGQPAPASRVIVWDVAKKAIEKSINVPKSPEHMVLVQGKLVVTCPESQVVAIVDTKEKKVTKSVEVKIDGKELTPRAVFKDSPAGKVIVTCGGEDRGGFDAQTVEIGLADGSVKPLYFGMSRGAAHVAVAKDYVAWTDGSWGSVTKLSELRKAPKKGENKGFDRIDGDERNYQLMGARAVNNGANFVAADPGRNKTGLLSPDWKKVVWTTDGILAGVHPSKPVAIVFVSDPNRSSETDSLTFRGVNSQSGRQVWQLVVKMPQRTRLDAWTFLRGSGIEVRAAKDGEELIFYAGRDSFDRGGQWYRVALPNRDGGGTLSVTNEPPTEIETGATLDWAPTIKGGSPSFTLKAGPDGMTVDAKTGKLSWKPDETSIGKHDVVLIAKVGADEIPISFELRVKRGKSDKKDDEK